LLLADRYIPSEHSSSRYAPFDLASGDDFTPQASSDSALTSYAQLAASRLGAERAFISFFDSTYQHILAESTPTLSLNGGRTAHDNERLILGSCIFPKERGVCHYVVAVPRREHESENTGGDDDTLVVLDVTRDKRLETSKLQAELSEMRFVMAVPIISPRGFKIGALSVMDSTARSSGPDQHSRQFMKDMAATVMEYLALKEATVQSRRAERMIVGLGSFVEGRSTLRDSWPEAHAQSLDEEKSGQSTEGRLNYEQQDLQEQDLQQLAEEPKPKPLAIREPSTRANHSRTNSHHSDSSNLKTQDGQADNHQKPGIEFSQDNNTARAFLTGSGLKEDALPSSIRNVFSRAANLLRESVEAEGVIFLDANSQRFGNLVDETKRRVSGSGHDDAKSSGDDSIGSDQSPRQSNSYTNQDSDTDGPRVSECLGFSSSTVSSINDEAKAGQAVVVPEPLFTSLIRRYPRGKIFSFNAKGSVSEDSDSRSQKDSGSDHNSVGHAEKPRSSSKRRRRPAFQRHADDLIKIFAGARNILVLPIWDSDRSRWFAGVLIWTNNPHRVFTLENELVYTSAFTNSVMAEIRRIDVEVAERAKTNLVSSITHELRNPLHGILGTADILSDTAMNALQHGMVHTVESCGRTLLDTINSLLDLTFIDQYRKGDTSQNSKDSKKSTTQQNMPLGENQSFSHVELDAVLEEVTDCVFAGHCFYNNPQAPPPALTKSTSRSAGQADQAEPVGPRSRQVSVIFDIESGTEWVFNTHAGAWRRIVMNILGNALKYTDTGYIYLGLKSTPSKQKEGFDVTITVKDTGKGIGPKFLQNDLFSPFKQEDSLAPGSGLGLSIVRQAVALLRGSVEIESTVGQGTQISIHAPLTKSTATSASSSGSLASLKNLTEGKTIGILGFGQSLRSQRDTAIYSSLERMCRDWFGLEVTNLSPSEGTNFDFDFFLALQTELDCEDTEGRDLFGLARRFKIGEAQSAPVIVICQSPEEAHRMFVASRNRTQTTSFEFVSQPCGPRKLARAVKMCIERQRDQQQGRRDSNAPTHWVEMPESSQLPVDIQAREDPRDRMKISKRPTADTMGNQESRSSQYTESPRADQDHASPSTLSPQRAEGALGEGDQDHLKRSVLLVDDNDVNLQLLCAYVQKDGYTYKSAQNGAQAVDVFKANPGSFDVVFMGTFSYTSNSFLLSLLFQTVIQFSFFEPLKLMMPDITMPVMDGFQASREIRRIENEYRAGLSESDRAKHSPAIIAALTGLGSANAQKEALGSGINTFLVKPLKRKQLQAILRREI
jgi:signal transduction histidine kinase/DNA-binding response OmpR family regulator/GAF domain-containing protein